MDGVLGVIEVKDDELGWAGVGGDKLIHQHERHTVEFGTRDAVFKPRYRRLRSQGGTGFRQAIEQQFEDGIVAQGVGVVGIFIARGNLSHALFEQVMQGKVDPAWIP